MTRYVPKRRLPNNLAGERMPRDVREWATLYAAGYTLERIALETGWRPGRPRPGTFAPATIRQELRKWGVELRRPGGRGSTGSSILVRVAELEARVRELERLSRM